MIIAFSFLSLLSSNYEEKIKKFNTYGENNWIHFDVMDGEFVTNKTFDYNLVKEINNYNKLFSDVHLMINKPHKVIKKYAKVGAKQITFHYEAVKEKNIIKIIKKIKKQGVKVGISIKPDTNVEALNPYLNDLDFILVMSVEPGKGGQTFMDSSLSKIKYLKEKQNEYNYLIGVDGGINDSTSKLVKEAGCDVIIVGSYLANKLTKKTLESLK